MKQEFHNRHEELAALRSAWERPEAQFFVLYGRRRVGKTAILREFADGIPAFHYVAARLPEPQQLAELGKALGSVVGDRLLESTGFQNWEQVFDYLARFPKRMAFMLDEYPYLTDANPALSSLWQRAWDESLANSNAYVVMCGSSVAMMEREVLDERAPLYGRRTGQLRVKPMGFSDAKLFLPHYSFEDQVRVFSIAGGVPYYLNFFDDRISVSKNIRERVLDIGAPLLNEVEFLLRQELREPRVYFGILFAIAAGKRKISEILNATGLSASTVSKYISVLQNLGLVEREVPITEKRPEKSKRGLYRIVDPFVRFWFRFVFAQQGLLETGRTEEAYKVVVRDLDHFVSHTYEEICRDAVARGLLDQITGTSWAHAGRWWGGENEIDLVAMTLKRDEFLVGEVKWSKRPVGTDILKQLETATPHIKHVQGNPSYFVLFSRSGFTENLIEATKERKDVILVHGLEILNNQNSNQVQ